MLDSISNFIAQFFAKKDQSVLGVDIGSSAIKVVQLSRKNGRAILETYGELALGPYASGTVGQATNLPTEKVAEAMRDLLNEEEVKIKTRSCGIAIPFAASLMSVIEMPNVSSKELARMIPIEARKYIPVPISEVVLDWSVIPKDKVPEGMEVETPLDENGKEIPPKTEVMVIALHNNTIEKYKEIVSKSSLNASFFEIEIFSTMRSVLDQEINPVMILDMGATSTKLYIVEQGILRSSHIITRGSQGVTSSLSKSLGISMQEAEILKREKGLLGVAGGVGVGSVITVTLDYIFSETNQVALAYQKKYNKNISKIILVGGGSSLKGLVDVAKKSLQSEIICGDPFSKVVAPAFLEEILRNTGPEFAVAMGIALRKLQELD